MKLIISIENLKEFRPISEDIPSQRILPYIQEAHQIDLKRLLGDPLYVDFIAKFDQTGLGAIYTAYQELLVGKSYTWAQQTIEHPGLIGFVSYSALVRFYNNNQINVTKYGLVQKKVEQSESITPQAVTAAVAEMRANALALQFDIQNFLRVNAATYPLYGYSKGDLLQDMGVKFFDPDQPSTKNQRTTISL